MRYIAIDYGDKRIGFAGSDSGSIATPLEIITITDPNNRFRQIVKRLKNYQPEEIILGNPLKKSGAAGSLSSSVGEFKKELEKEFPNSKIHIINEIFTSIEAANRSNRKMGQPIDDIAAQIILDSFLAGR